MQERWIKQQCVRSPRNWCPNPSIPIRHPAGKENAEAAEKRWREGETDRRRVLLLPALLAVRGGAGRGRGGERRASPGWGSAPRRGAPGSGTGGGGGRPRRRRDPPSAPFLRCVEGGRSRRRRRGRGWEGKWMGGWMGGWMDVVARLRPAAVTR
jgi:hypothetical protein